MPGMPPEAMAAQEEGQEAGGSATKLVQDVGGGLAKLAEMLNGSQATTDQDRQQMAQIMDLFTDLVEKKLGGAQPGEDAPPEEMPADQGAVPMQGGRTGKPMGPNTRM